MTFWNGHIWVRDAHDPRTRRARPVRDWVLTALMILGLLAPLLILYRAAGANPEVEVTPASGAVGTPVLISGSGFAPHARIALSWDSIGATVASVTTSKDGAFRVRVAVPSSSLGPHRVSASAQQGGSATNGKKRAVPDGLPLASTFFDVVTPLPSPTPVPTALPPATPSPTAVPSVRPTTTPTPTPVATPVSTSTPVPSVAATPSPSGAPLPRGSSGFVGSVGTQLFLDGAPYRFTGLSIYNANSRSVSSCWYYLNQGTALDATLAAIGPGQEAFRAWFYQGLALTNGARDWSAFDKTLAVAAAHNMKVIASLSGEGGDCKDYPIDRHKYESWYASGYRSPEASGVGYRAWVAEVVARYRNNPTILAWQMMGEAEDPIDVSGACSSTANQTMKTWADDVSAVIKSHDPNHLVTIGVIGSGQCGASGTAYVNLHTSPNIDLCTHEDYGNPTVPMPGDQWNGLLVRIQQCAVLGKPLFVSESGISRSDPNRLVEWDAKFRTQFAAGVAGELIWDWSTGEISDGYEVLPGEPVLQLLTKY